MAQKETVLRTSPPRKDRLLQETNLCLAAAASRSRRRRRCGLRYPAVLLRLLLRLRLRLRLRVLVLCLARKVEHVRPHRHIPAPKRPPPLVLSTFPMLVPSLSRQNDGFNEY